MVTWPIGGSNTIFFLQKGNVGTLPPPPPHHPPKHTQYDTYLDVLGARVEEAELRPQAGHGADDADRDGVGQALGWGGGLEGWRVLCDVHRKQNKKTTAAPPLPVTHSLSTPTPPPQKKNTHSQCPAHLRAAQRHDPLPGAEGGALPNLGNGELRPLGVHLMVFLKRGLSRVGRR